VWSAVFESIQALIHDGHNIDACKKVHKIYGHVQLLGFCLSVSIYGKKNFYRLFRHQIPENFASSIQQINHPVDRFCRSF
jgi:hypothetical protein